MKVADYRSNIQALWTAYHAMNACRGPIEMARGAERIRTCARRLMAAECKTAKPADRADAERAIDITASYLIRHNL